MTDALTPEEMDAYQSLQDKVDQSIMEMGVLKPPPTVSREKVAATSENQTMDKQQKTSPETSSEPMHPLERASQKLNRRLRASGRTVTEVEPSVSTEYVVTFPPNRAPKAKPQTE